MEYLNIDTETEPNITGSRNGVYSVEIRDKFSFYSIEDKKIWKEYCSEIRKNKSKLLLNNYAPLDTTLLNSPFLFFPIGKKIKFLDFMAFAPHERGTQFLITKRVYEIISKYRLPIHNKIPAKIDSFNQDYYLIGFPMLPKNDYDFKKCTFFDYRNGGQVKFKDVEDYETADYDRITASAQKLYLNEKLEYDIIKTTKGVFFLSEIIKEFEREKVTGYTIKEGILFN